MRLANSLLLALGALPLCTCSIFVSDSGRHKLTPCDVLQLHDHFIHSTKILFWNEVASSWCHSGACVVKLTCQCSGAKIVYIDGSWDMFHSGHIDIIKVLNHNDCTSLTTGFNYREHEKREIT